MRSGTRVKVTARGDFYDDIVFVGEFVGQNKFQTTIRDDRIGTVKIYTTDVISIKEEGES